MTSVKYILNLNFESDFSILFVNLKQDSYIFLMQKFQTNIIKILQNRKLQLHSVLFDTIFKFRKCYRFL